MQQFLFADMIREYSIPVTIVAISRGKYVAGDYQAGDKTSTEIYAAVLPMSAQKIYQSGGAYTSEDRDMYVAQADDSIVFDSGAQYFVVDGSRKFHVEAADNYGTEYADFNHYSLKRVDSFDV